ncbi:ImmA/IrrE family metallo-endopeptidase [Streptomyces sp. NPDC057694]|uniref:ImmA/IrrE family metallo-endopeptidase n=1 Tax=Streptomyces sp. NPDC057694 TaxID=3346216 RepID=UPI0036A99F54
MALKPVPITGSVLAWTRAEAGMSPAALADAVGASTEEVIAWESDRRKPSTGQFKELAKRLGRPESFFFLARPPQIGDAAVSFRTTIEKLGSPASTIEVGKELRLAQRVQRVASWLHNQLDSHGPKIPKSSTSAAAASLAKELQQWLHWDLNVQLNSTEAQVTKALRGRLEEHGLIILHIPIDTETGVRGFSLPHSTTPVVVINTKERYGARTFSYIHELAHLALGDDSLCLVKTDEGVERWCNEVAACFLMPEHDVRSFVRARYGGTKISSLEQVSPVRNRYKVSTQAAALRLHKLNLSEPGFYPSVHWAMERRKGGGSSVENVRTRDVVRLQTYGRGYLNLLFEAKASRKIPETQVLELLKISRSELSKLEFNARSSVEGG